MDARAVTIRELLAPTDPGGALRRVQLRVPVFQRAYEWRPETIERLLNDVLGRITGPADAPAHFVGSFVLLDEPEQPGAPDRYMVIDGQQRLLTLVVTLARAERRIPGVTSVLVNAGGGFLDRLRVVPADVDRTDFLAVLDGAEPASDRALRNAVRVADRLTADLDPATVRDGILDRVQIVRIVLDRREDAEAVFESLNTTGQPLTQADLVRTALLAAFPTIDEQREVDATYWRPTEERLRALVPDRQRYERSSPKDRIVGEYLRSFLMRGGDRLDDWRLYRTFADSFDRSQDASLAFLRAFERLSRAYALLVPAPALSPRLQTPHQVMRRLGYNVHHPLLLQLAERAGAPSPDFPVEDLDQVPRGLESFFIRRIAVGWPTNRLYRLFADLCRARPSDQHEIWRTLEPHWPSDARFARGIMEQSIYETNASTASVMLGRLDAIVDAKDSTLDEEATLEHVMPQTIGTDVSGRAWREMLGPDWQQLHARWLHTLPNLTLTKRNSEMSNKPFAAKRSWLLNSKFATSRAIGNLDRWDGETLTARSEMLARAAVELWRLPPGIKGYQGGPVEPTSGEQG